MTTSQNTCPALAGIAKAILTNLSAEDLADVLRSVEPAVMQEALVRSQIVGMDPSHLQLAIDYGMIDKETILETIGHDKPSLGQVLSEFGNASEVVPDLVEVFDQDEILTAMGLDGSLIGPMNEIDTDLVVSRLEEQRDGLVSLMGSVYGHHNEEDIMSALLEHVSTGAILDTFDSHELGEAAGMEWRHEDDMSDSWLADRLDRDIVMHYLRDNL